MIGFKRLHALSAVMFIVSGIALALAAIAGIWSDVNDRWVDKTIASLGILFLLSGFVHLVAFGMTRESKGMS